MNKIQQVLDEVRNHPYSPYQKHLIEHLSQAEIGYNAHINFVSVSNVSVPLAAPTTSGHAFGHKPRNGVYQPQIDSPDKALEILECND